MQVGNFGFGSSGSGGGGGTIGGGGTLNYVAKFTPNGATISNSLLYDNGTSVGIGTTTPDASAILDLTSTSQGFMTPRMTTLDKNSIVSPATSLLLFDTTQNLFSYWDGAAWVNLNNGGIFGANNGLSISGSDVQLGGSLIQPTTISSSGVNTFSVTDDVGTMIRTRDSNGNFIINAVGGNPTFTNSNYIFAFTSDGGTSFTDSTIVYNFGGANSFTQTVDTFSFGDYHTFNGVSQSYNFGRNNTASNSTNIHLFGDFNILNSCSSVSVFGDNNTINSENAKFFIGNNNNNLVVNGSNGYVGIGTASPNAMLDIIASGSGTVGLNLNTSSTQDSKIHFRTNNAASARSQIYLEDATQTLNVYTVNNDTIFWNGNGLAQVKTLTLFTNNTAKFENFVYVGTNITLDGLDTTNYPLSIHSSRNDLTRIQNLNTGNTQTDIQIGNNNGANSIYYGVNISGNSFIDNRTGNLLFQNTGATQMTFDNIGRLGIGITPTYMLDILSSSATVFKAHGNGVSNNSVFSSSNQSVSLTLDTAVSSQLGSVGSTLLLRTLGVTYGSFYTNSSNTNTTLKSENGYWLNLVNGTTESIGLGQGGNYMQFNMNGVNNMILVGSTGNFGIGVNPNPTAKLYVSGIDATTKATLRLEPVANVTEDTGGNTLNTTTNATVALETIAIPTDTVVMIESYVTCRKTGGAGAGTVGQGNGYIRTVKAKNVGGVVTIGVVQSSFTSEDIAPLDATFAVSGTNIVLNVTGANNDNITWNSITKKYKVA